MIKVKGEKQKLCNLYKFTQMRDASIQLFYLMKAQFSYNSNQKCAFICSK